MARLHNVTLYVARDEFDMVRAFYSERLGLPVIFEETGHICCFAVGDDLAVCLHEPEPGHPAGARELFLWVDDATEEIRLTDPLGTQIRLHERRR